MNEDNFVEEWAAHYPTRKMYHSEAANYLRAKQPPPEQPVEQPDQLIPQSNLWERSKPGHEDVPAMPDPRNVPDTLSDDEKPGMVAQFIKTIYPQAQLDDNIIAGIVGDFARPFTDNPAGPAMAGGVRDLGQGLVDVASEVSDALGLGPIDVELPQIESADDPAAHLVRGMTQFFAGFGAAGGLAKGASFMRQTLAGGAADATFDPELGNLSTLLREQFNVDNALTNYLDAKVGEDADAAERLNARVKMVLEGAGLGALVPAAMFTMRQMKEGAPEAIQAVKDVIAGRPGNLQKQLGMVSWHGTPHKWESGVPDLSKVGTGEGAQAYGHGIYFAEKEGVAKSYLPNEEDASFLLDGKKVDTPWTSEIRERWPDLYSGLSEERAEVLDVVLANIGQVSAEGDLIHVLNNFNGPERQIYSTLIEKKLVHSGVPTGNLYKVDIPDAEIDRMLDYDAPLKNQNDLVKEMLRDVLKEMKFLGPNDNGPRQLTSAWKAARMQYADMNDGDTGAAIYRVLGSRNTSSVEYLSRDPSLPSVDPRKLASEYLASKGIPGIKYLDQGSRDANKGTRNFVVFDEELLNKLKVGEAE
jgi:hypothetical protein